MLLMEHKDTKIQSFTGRKPISIRKSTKLAATQSLCLFMVDMLSGSAIDFVSLCSVYISKISVIYL